MVHVHAVKGDDGGRRVEKVEIAVGGKQTGDGPGQGVRGQRAGGDNHLPLGDGNGFLRRHRDAGVGADSLRDGGGEPLPVHSQGAARLHPRLIGTAQDQRPASAQLLFEEPHGVFQLVGAQGVGAHQLGKARAVVGGGHFMGLHFRQNDGNAPLGQLPGALAPSQARADDGDIHGYHILSLWSERPTK